MRGFIQLFLILTIALSAQAQKPPVKLLVRADDMASFHDANVAIMHTVQNGIARSIEIMVNCPWFPEAVKMLNDNPTIDVGLHLMITSEWDQVKWRPLTPAPSITDQNGNFYPFIWGPKEQPQYLLNHNWKLEEIESELRAQIELALRNLPQISHLSAHMGFSHMAPSVNELVRRLGKEYKLAVEEDFDLLRFPEWENKGTTDSAVSSFIAALKQLKPGNYLFVEHPGLLGDEMKAVERNVAQDRQRVTDLLTHPDIKGAIQELNIELVSYSDLLTK